MSPRRDLASDDGVSFDRRCDVHGSVAAALPARVCHHVVVQDAFIERCAKAAGAAVSDGAFSPGPAVWVGRREVAHFDADGSLDVRLTKALIRERKAELAADHRVELRRNASDWLAVKFRADNQDDISFAGELVQAAVAANRANRPTA